MQNSVVSIQILAKIYGSLLKKVVIIRFSSILIKTSENCFYIVNLYFPCIFSMHSCWRSYLTVLFPYFFCWKITRNLFTTVKLRTMVKNWGIWLEQRFKAGMSLTHSVSNGDRKLTVCGLRPDAIINITIEYHHYHTGFHTFGASL